MRGSDERSGSLFSYVDIEARVLRHIQCGTSENWLTEPWRSWTGSLRRYIRRMGVVDSAERLCGRACCSCSIRSALNAADGALDF